LATEAGPDNAGRYVTIEISFCVIIMS
jgi:hypothetical protein